MPPDWVQRVQHASEDTLFDMTEHLPAEAMEALLDYVASGVLRPPGETGADPFAHPDAQRRFRTFDSIAEMERALDFPWEKWAVFLHPAQRQVVEKTWSGPVRISGSAGTGKTIVALHRAVALARRHGEARILLTTFSTPLANALHHKLMHLAGNRSGYRRTHHRAFSSRHGPRPVHRGLRPANPRDPRIGPRSGPRPVGRGVRGGRPAFCPAFPVWRVRRCGRCLATLDLGRLPHGRPAGTQDPHRRPATRERYCGRSSPASGRGAALAEQGAITWPALFARLAEHHAAGTPPFDCAVIDEAQDVGVAEMRFLVALAGRRSDGLFFTGDLGQRIFQQPFSWKSLGVDIRGRSQTLRINYRTSHQIRSHADRLLPGMIADVDGNGESRDRTISLFNGPPPEIRTFPDPDAERQSVAGWLMDLFEDGIEVGEIGVFVRSSAELPRARAAVAATGLAAVELGQTVETAAGKIAISPMHLAKGLEFRAVVVMACDDEIIPSQERIENVADDADLEEVHTTERHLLYVACTRARDHLLITGVEPASEFLDDFREESLSSHATP